MKLFFLTFLVVASSAIPTAAPGQPPPLSHEPTNPVTIIALASMIISLVTGVAMVLGQRRTASNEYVIQLEKRLEAVDRELQRAEARITHLELENSSLLKENISLLQTLAGLKQQT